MRDAHAGVRGNGAFPESLPRVHRMVVFLLPLRIGAISIAADGKHGGGKDRHRRRHDILGSCAERRAAKPAAAQRAVSIFAVAQPARTARTNDGGENTPREHYRHEERAAARAASRRGKRQLAAPEGNLGVHVPAHRRYAHVVWAREAEQWRTPITRARLYKGRLHRNLFKSKPGVRVKPRSS